MQALELLQHCTLTSDWWVSAGGDSVGRRAGRLT